jgi:carbonic anhydrase
LYAIAIGDVNSIALIGHSNCRMVGFSAKKDPFIQGLVQITGWEPKRALEQFTQNLPLF